MSADIVTTENTLGEPSAPVALSDGTMHYQGETYHDSRLGSHAGMVGRLMIRHKDTSVLKFGRLRIRVKAVRA